MRVITFPSTPGFVSFLASVVNTDAENETPKEVPWSPATYGPPRCHVFVTQDVRGIRLARNVFVLRRVKPPEGRGIAVLRGGDRHVCDARIQRVVPEVAPGRWRRVKRVCIGGHISYVHDWARGCGSVL